MTTQLQKWARERNLDKGRVSSIRTLSRWLSKHKSMTAYESGLLKDVASLCALILEDWEARATVSKAFYLRGDQHEGDKEASSAD